MATARPTKATVLRDRHDYGALEQRVYGAERKIDDLSAQMSSEVRSLRSDLSTQISDLGRDFKAQQTAQIESGRTRWTPIVSAGGALAVAFISIFSVVGSMALTPVRGDVVDLKQGAKEAGVEFDKKIDDINVRMTPLLTLGADQRANVIRFTSIEKAIDGKWSTDAQGEYEKRIDEVTKIYQDFATRDLAQQKADIAVVSADQIKRPEINTQMSAMTSQIVSGLTSVNDRYTALSARVNEVQHEFGANFTMGDAVKDLQAQIRELRSGPSGIAPLGPITPLAPLK
jgi:hypothetical protein